MDFMRCPHRRRRTPRSEEGGRSSPCRRGEAQSRPRGMMNGGHSLPSDRLGETTTRPGPTRIHLDSRTVRERSGGDGGVSLEFGRRTARKKSRATGGVHGLSRRSGRSSPARRRPTNVSSLPVGGAKMIQRTLARASWSGGATHYHESAEKEWGPELPDVGEQQRDPRRGQAILPVATREASARVDRSLLLSPYPGQPHHGWGVPTFSPRAPLPRAYGYPSPTPGWQCGIAAGRPLRQS